MTPPEVVVLVLVGIYGVAAIVLGLAWILDVRRDSVLEKLELAMLRRHTLEVARSIEVPPLSDGYAAIRSKGGSHG